MRQQYRSSLLRYGVAILSTTLAFLLRLMLTPLVGESIPFILFFPAIALSAWYGGLGPGLLATILSGLYVFFFFLSAYQSLLITDPVNVLSFVLFLLTGLLLSGLNESLHRTRRQVEETAKKLNETNEHFHLLVESVQDYGIFMLDTQGRIASWNLGAQRIMGYTAEEIVGQPFSTFYTRGDTENGKPTRELHTAVVEGRVESEDWRVRKDGSWFWASVIVTAMRDEAGELHGFVKITRDITERRQAQEELREREQRLQAVLDNTAISVYIKDLEGRYLFVSRGFEQVYGRHRSEILGRTDFDLAQPEFAQAFREHDQRILNLSEPIVIEEDVKTHDGIALTYLSSKFPLRNADGQPYAVCGISTDITERKQAEREISRLLQQEQVARAESEAANRAKDEFLSVLSHELRTPLTSILGWISLLRSNRLDADTAEQALETIERNAKIQINLVEDLLDVSRIISGKLSVDLHPLNPAPVVEAAVNAIRPAADAKGIQIQLQLDPSCIVLADGNRLQQIVDNLLSNAVKFTPKDGHVTTRLEQSGAQVQIVVTDSGQGIHPDFLPQVFEHFRQADSSPTRRHGGLGLGLAIVRHLVQAHGGMVRAESAGEGHGTTFTVQLPALSRTTEEAPEDVKAASPLVANAIPVSVPVSINGHATDKTLQGK